MKTKHKQLFIDFAKRTSDLSYAERKKVGAFLVTPTDICLYSYNGTAEGDSNECEDENDTTLPEVSHAEINIICKAAKVGIPLLGSSMFVTLSPCIECSKGIFRSGITHVYFSELYRKSDGVEYLINHGVNVFILGDNYEEQLCIETLQKIQQEQGT